MPPARSVFALVIMIMVVAVMLFIGLNEESTPGGSSVKERLARAAHLHERLARKLLS